MPSAKFKPNRRRSPTNEALIRLRSRWESGHEDDEWKAAAEPIITPMLKSVGLPAVVEALRMHSDEDAREFLEVYDSITKTDRAHLRIEDIALRQRHRNAGRRVVRVLFYLMGNGNGFRGCVVCPAGRIPGCRRFFRYKR